ncbi:MAG TPA: hypothetical protein PKK12_08005 [Candidatus Aminicenantes bacterium]|nr:hypothetical protein [Candidatus Aminicenantes bacterium]
MKMKIRNNRRINPEKSNKMIVAVTLGLLVVFVLFVWMITRGGGGKDDRQRMEAAVSYLKGVDGLGAREFFPAENRLCLTVDATFTGDAEAIVRCAALRLDNALSRPAVGEWLRGGRVVYRVRTSEGEVASEERFPTP